MHTGKRLVVALVLAGGCLAPGGMARASPFLAGTLPADVLQVPYVAQSELLCGGAAIAMVERWWGRRGVYAEEFAPLVRPVSGGILTTDLVQATRARGWQAQVVTGTPEMVRQSLRDSIPVVALIQVAKQRYHYVVIVGWSDDHVVYHDPAVAPFATLKVAEFLKRWRGADHWALIVQPLPTTAILPSPPLPASVDSLPCRPWLDRAADAASNNMLAEAERLLFQATAACPSEQLVGRELAGLRLRQGRYAESIHLSEAYLRAALSDTLGWQLLASGRYLAGDATGALSAWNRVGRPLVDLLHVDGSHHVRFRVLADAIDIPLRHALIPGALSLAARRLADLPALALAKVSYIAVPGGVVEVRAAVVERPVLESPPRLMVATAVRAVVNHELGVTVTTPMGAGEQWSLRWRWESAHPRRLLRLDIPTRIGLPGVVTLEGSWEQYRFADGIADEQRKATALGFKGWVRSSLEAMAGVRLERWQGQGDFVAFSIGGAVHGLHDRFSLVANAEQVVSPTDRPGYTRLRTLAAWSSPIRPAAITWSSRLGVDWVSVDAPRGLWPMAGGSLARDIPLRAHSVNVEGRLPLGRSGRVMMHGGVAGDRPIATIGQVALGAGVFLDGADVMKAGSDARQHQWFLDGGVGLRVGLVGAARGAIRLDLARGFLAEQRWGLSVGLEQPLPLRPRTLP